MQDGRENKRQRLRKPSFDRYSNRYISDADLLCGKVSREHVHGVIRTLTFAVVCDTILLKSVGC